MKFTTIVPTVRNDGTVVRQDELDEIVLGLAIQFGGATIEGKTFGHWIDPRDGQHFQDEGIKVSVVCDNVRLGEAEGAVKLVGERLEQRAMYFEVRELRRRSFSCDWRVKL